MSTLLPWMYVIVSAALFGALCFQGRLTTRVRELFSRTPLIYSQLPLPEGVDLRSVLENPRLSYFSLAITGTFIRILLGIVLFLGFDVWAPSRPPWVKALVVLVVLVLAELVPWVWRANASAPIGRATALAMRAIGGGVRLMPGATETGSTVPDALGGEVVSTVDGQEMFDPVAKRFLGGLLKLKRTTVQQAMIPRERMVTLKQDWSVGRAARMGTDVSFARIPVVGKDEEIIGLVHTKDMLLLLHSNQSAGFVKSIMRDVDYAPTTQRLDTLLRKFQKSRVHIAVARDEYGRAVGLITMDDILRVALTPEAGQ